MSWETTDVLSADTTDVLSADTTDVLSADTTDVLSADTGKLFPVKKFHTFGFGTRANFWTSCPWRKNGFCVWGTGQILDFVPVAKKWVLGLGHGPIFGLRARGEKMGFGSLVSLVCQQLLRQGGGIPLPSQILPLQQGGVYPPRPQSAHCSSSGGGAAFMNDL